MIILRFFKKLPLALFCFSLAFLSPFFSLPPSALAKNTENFYLASVTNTKSKTATTPKKQTQSTSAKAKSTQKTTVQKKTTAKKATQKKTTAKRATQKKTVAKKTTQKKQNRQARAKVPSHRYKGVVAYDLNAEKKLFSDKAHDRIAPASLTKVLSMFVALDAMRTRNLSEKTIVTVSKKAGETWGSRMGLAPGDRVSLDALLKGMAIASGNDASVAIAEFIAGSEYEFVNLMNKKARAVGMSNSVFKNAHGLPAAGQYTTPADMLALTRSYLNTYPQNLAKYHNHTSYTYKQKVSKNSNPLLDKYPGGDGLKTGFVNASGFNLIATAKQGDKRVIVVLLGCPTKNVREREINAMLASAFSSRPTLPTLQQAKDLSAQSTPKGKQHVATLSHNVTTQKKLLLAHADGIFKQEQLPNKLSALNVPNRYIH